MKKKFQFKYISGFDGLRGFAALFILLLHGSYGFFIGGWIGVDLFFVLSGFLITSLLQEEYKNTGSISIFKFYVRRFLRLFPALIICIILCNILWPVTALYPGSNQLLATSAAFFYFINLLKVAIAGNMAHLWSLSVEEHFYLFWPVLLLFFIFNLSERRQIIFIVFLLLVVTTVRIIIANVGELGSAVFIIGPNRFTFCKMDGVLVGALLAFCPFLWYQRGEVAETKEKNTLLILMLAAIFLVILITLDEKNIFWLNGGFLLTDLLCGSMVLVALRHPNHFLLSNRILCWLGKRSYGIYVYHFPIFLVLERLREPHNMTNLLIITLLRFTFPVIFAAASYKYLEQPVLKLKRKYEVRKAIYPE